MLYIVRVYDGKDVYEYEYGNEQHAREHMKWEPCRAELFAWKAGREWSLDGVVKTLVKPYTPCTERQRRKIRLSEARKV